MTPQLTEQYGHVERVSFAREIFNARSCANAGFRSNPNAAAAAPPTAPIFRKSLREDGIEPPTRKRPPKQPSIFLVLSLRKINGNLRDRFATNQLDRGN